MCDNNPNKSTCLLTFGKEIFVFQFAAQKYKGQDTQNYNFVCFVWV